MYWKKGFLERATWKRLPTRGQPGGPGGRLGRFFLGFLVRRKIRPERKMAMKEKVEGVKKENILKLKKMRNGERRKKSWV